MQIHSSYKNTMEIIRDNPSEWVYSNDGIELEHAASIWEKCKVLIRCIFKPSIFGSKLDKALMNLFPKESFVVINATLADKTSKKLNEKIVAKRTVYKSNPELFKTHVELYQENHLGRDTFVEFEPDNKLLKRFRIFKIADRIDQLNKGIKIPL